MNTELFTPKYSEIYDKKLEMQQAAKARALGACATEPVMDLTNTSLEQPEVSEDL